MLWFAMKLNVTTPKRSVPIERDAAVSKEAEGSNREDDVVFTSEAALDGCSQRVIANDAAAHFLHLAAADANICSDK